MKKERSTFAIFRSLYNILPKKSLFKIGIIFILFISAVEILITYTLKEMIDSAINNSMSQFISTLYLLLTLALCDFLFLYLRTKILGVYSESGIQFIRNKLSSKYNQLDFEVFSNHHTGDYVSRATNDVNKVKNYLNNTFPGLIYNPLTGTAAFIYLLFLSWKLTLISLGVIPIVIILVTLISKPLSSMSKKLQEKLGVANSHIQDYIKGVEVSKAYQLEESLGDNYKKVIDDSVYYGKKIAKTRAIIMTLSQLFSIIPFFITFFLGGYYVIQNEMTVGGLLAFINLLNYVTNPIMQLPRLISTAKVDLAACDRILEMLDNEEERKDGESYEINEELPVIEFSNVKFSYPCKNDLVLNSLNLAINKGEKIALVGPSGGGKSTILRLLLGYYKNYEGDINVFGNELKTWNLEELRKQLSLVSQDTYLFPDTIEENISYGKFNEDFSLSDIKEAAEIANASSFIQSFPKQFKTPIGELGNRLSGGQKQRISIARAVLKNSEILLLDEATSSLDNESESLVQEALERLMESKTSIVIAHRLSTIKNVDRILVIADGKIVEEGNHEELLNLNGLYTNLYKKQMKNENDDTQGRVA